MKRAIYVGGVVDVDGLFLNFGSTGYVTEVKDKRILKRGYRFHFQPDSPSKFGWYVKEKELYFA